MRVDVHSRHTSASGVENTEGHVDIDTATKLNLYFGNETVENEGQFEAYIYLTRLHYYSYRRFKKLT